MDTLGPQEVDSIMEILMAIFLCIFGVYSIINVVNMLSNHEDDFYREDKIKSTYYVADIKDPYYMTPYQAIMMAWHMDTQSEVSLTYTSSMTPIDVNAEANKDKAAVFDYFDESGRLRDTFIGWRNQKIGGYGIYKDYGLIKLYESLGSKTEAFYRGGRNPGEIVLHLEMNGDYVADGNHPHSGNEPNTGGKIYQWILRPMSAL